MEEKRKKLTLEGLKKIEKELEYLKVVKSKEIAEKLQEARAQGDLSENAEYDAAKEEQRNVAARIEDLEQITKNYELIDCIVVKLLDLELNEEQVVKIVGSSEVDVLNGMISSDSPLGMALANKKKGSVVEVAAPGGTFSYKILEVSKPKRKEEK